METINELVGDNIPRGSELMAIIRVGSKAYGLDTPTSDTDYRCVYKQSNKDILSGKYVPTVQITKDVVAYELRHFLHQLNKGSFTAMEMLFVGFNNFQYTSNAWDLEILLHRKRFIGPQLISSMMGFIKGNYGLGQPKQYSNQLRIAYVAYNLMESGKLDFTVSSEEVKKQILNIKHSTLSIEAIQWGLGMIEDVEESYQKHRGTLTEGLTKGDYQELEYKIRMEY